MDNTKNPEFQDDIEPVNLDPDAAVDAGESEGAAAMTPDPVQQYVSFDPDDATDERESLELEAVINSPWKPKDEEKKLYQISKCHKLLPRLIKSLSYKLKHSMGDIAACTMLMGIGELCERFEPEIEAIREARAYVNLSGAKWEDRDYFDRDTRVEFGTSELEDFSLRIPESIVARCDGLASDIGFRTHNIRQIALMAGLILSRSIAREDQLVMIEVIKGFRKQLKEKADGAREIRVAVEAKQKNIPVLTAVENAWQEIETD